MEGLWPIYVKIWLCKWATIIQPNRSAQRTTRIETACKQASKKYSTSSVMRDSITPNQTKINGPFIRSITSPLQSGQETCHARTLDSLALAWRQALGILCTWQVGTTACILSENAHVATCPVSSNCFIPLCETTSGYCSEFSVLPCSLCVSRPARAVLQPDLVP